MPPRGRPASHDRHKVAEMRAAGMKWSEIAEKLGITQRTAMRSAQSPRQMAIDLAVRFGGVDGENHKAWVIDQMVRILAGKDYDRVVREAKAGEDGPDTYRWDTGVAP